jgi:hypothetical protein
MLSQNDVILGRDKSWLSTAVALDFAFSSRVSFELRMGFMNQETKEAFNYLKDRGYGFRGAFIYEGEPRLWIEHLLLPYHQVRNLAALERMKDHVHGPDSPALIQMASACSKLAETGKLNSEFLELAEKIKKDWATLVQRATPNAGRKAEADVLEVQAKELATRAVGFLSTQLHILFT